MTGDGKRYFCRINNKIIKFENIPNKRKKEQLTHENENEMDFKLDKHTHKNSTH